MSKKKSYELEDFDIEYYESFEWFWDKEKGKGKDDE